MAKNSFGKRSPVWFRELKEANKLRQAAGSPQITRPGR
jgi:hypothetical protein